MKVYIVMKGAYSDKHICGVAIDPDVAERIKKICTEEYDYCEPEIHEYETDFWSPVLQGGRLFHVTFRKDGSILEVIEYPESESYNYEYINEITEYEGIYSKECHIKVEVIALGLAHAKKIACDKRAEYLAMKEGI